MMSKDESNKAQARFPGARAKENVPDWYPELLDAVAGCIQTGRRRAVAAVNRELVSTYWAVGAEILARQEAEGWGARVIDRLSTDLHERFPDAKGFSPRNLKYMRAFAAAWPDIEIVQRSAAQLPWRQHMVLLDKLDSLELSSMPNL
jgi:predicted nuclease of restriction endonuclease-like (RecB) superfamily